MSSTRSDTLGNKFGQQSEWLEELLATEIPDDGQEMFCQGMEFRLENRIPTAVGLLSASQTQTSNSFGYQWQKEELFDKKEVLAQVRSWLIKRYGEIEEAGWWSEYGDNPVLLDAGCGAAISVIELCGARLNAVRYLGVDISEAVYVAESRFRRRKLKGMFVRCDLAKVPIEPESVDVIFSEGVLHHTDSTYEALGQVCTYLKPNGRILFYVYRKKGPVREFVDDHIRAQLSDLPPDEAWASLLPLTRLGQVLGDLDIEIDIPEDIDLLEIKKGRVNLQRFFYWNICKAYYRTDWSIEQMNNTNFDWYAPTNAFRQTPEEVRAWCDELHLEIEREYIDDAGITIVARKSTR